MIQARTGFCRLVDPVPTVRWLRGVYVPEKSTEDSIHIEFYNTDGMVARRVTISRVENAPIIRGALSSNMEMTPEIGGARHLYLLRRRDSTRSYRLHSLMSKPAPKMYTLLSFKSNAEEQGSAVGVFNTRELAEEAKTQMEANVVIGLDPDVLFFEIREFEINKVHSKGINTIDRWTRASEAFKKEYPQLWEVYSAKMDGKFPIRLPACTTMEEANAFGKLLKELKCVCLIRAHVSMYRYTGTGWYCATRIDERDKLGLCPDMFVVHESEKEVECHLDEIDRITGLARKENQHFYMWDANGNCV